MTNQSSCLSPVNPVIVSFTTDYILSTPSLDPMSSQYPMSSYATSESHYISRLQTVS